MGETGAFYDSKYSAVSEFVEEEARKDAEAEKTERCLELKWNQV